MGFKPDLWRPHGFLQCFDTVGLVVWLVKIVSEMSYNVLSGTLSLYTTDLPLTKSSLLIASRFIIICWCFIDMLSYCGLVVKMLDLGLIHTDTRTSHCWHQQWHDSCASEQPYFTRGQVHALRQGPSVGSMAVRISPLFAWPEALDSIPNQGVHYYVSCGCFSVSLLCFRCM